MKHLGIDEQKLLEINSYNTAKEIQMQPEIWLKAISNYELNKDKITQFLNKIGNDYQVIFSGAGTSEYVGNILSPILNSMQEKVDYFSYGTTDIVNNPMNFLKKHKKTLLVSFARSGDSPESVATVNLANQIFDEVYHLFITCNENGQLALMSKSEEFSNNSLVLLMPEGSNDKGFAMTSSFSSMLMTALLIFYNQTNPTKMREAVELAKYEMFDKMEAIKKIAYEDQERIIILGDGPFRGLAEELTLKVMELTAGLIIAKSDTTLGFRHGPKSAINNKTIVFQLMSTDEYAKQYAIDILSEMKEEGKANNIVCYSLNDNDKIREATKVLITPNECCCQSTFEKAVFTYLLYGQMYAFFKSQYFNLTTDNPFPSGDVNRVVKKFQIYNF